MSYSEEVLLAGAAVLDGRNFEYHLGRNHYGIERDRIAAVHHILDVTLPIIEAEEFERTAIAGIRRTVADVVERAAELDATVPQPFTHASDVGWGAF